MNESGKAGETTTLDMSGDVGSYGFGVEESDPSLMVHINIA
jgi:hypothetical protein